MEERHWMTHEALVSACLFATKHSIKKVVNKVRVLLQVKGAETPDWWKSKVTIQVFQKLLVSGWIQVVKDRPCLWYQSTLYIKKVIKKVTTLGHNVKGHKGYKEKIKVLRLATFPNAIPRGDTPDSTFITPYSASILPHGGGKGWFMNIPLLSPHWLQPNQAGMSPKSIP